MCAHVHVFASAVLILSTLLFIQIRLIQYPFLEEPALSEWLTCSCKCFADDTNWSAAERSNHYTRAMQQCTCPHPQPLLRPAAEAFAASFTFTDNGTERKLADEPTVIAAFCAAATRSPEDWRLVIAGRMLVALDLILIGPHVLYPCNLGSPHAYVRLATFLLTKISRIHRAHHDRKLVALAFV